MNERSTKSTGSTGEHRVYREANAAKTYEASAPDSRTPSNVKRSAVDSHHVDVGPQFEHRKSYVETTIDTSKQKIRREMAKINKKIRN